MHQRAGGRSPRSILRPIEASRTGNNRNPPSRSSRPVGGFPCASPRASRASSRCRRAACFRHRRYFHRRFYFSFANVRPFLGASSEARRVPASTPSLGSSPVAAVDVSAAPRASLRCSPAARWCAAAPRTCSSAVGWLNSSRPESAPVRVKQNTPSIHLIAHTRIRVVNKLTSAANKTMHAVAKAFVVVECTPSLTCVTCVHKTLFVSLIAHTRIREMNSPAGPAWPTRW